MTSSLGTARHFVASKFRKPHLKSDNSSKNAPHFYEQGLIGYQSGLCISCVRGVPCVLFLRLLCQSRRKKLRCVRCVGWKRGFMEAGRRCTSDWLATRRYDVTTRYAHQTETKLSFISSPLTALSLVRRDVGSPCPTFSREGARSLHFFAIFL